MRRILLFPLCVLSTLLSFAGRISGVVTDDKGNILAYSSVFIKGSTKGTTANGEGKYFLNLEPGNYIIVCQHVGYTREEKQVTVTEENQTLDFKLKLQELTLAEVVVKQGEDPAYEIIRQAIKKRPYYKEQLSNFQCEVYTKGELKLRNYPKKFMGQKVDFEDGDTSKRKMLYLSETIATYSVKKPNDVKVEVLSTKVSGQSDGFGLSAPQIFSFYENNIHIGNNLNPRGFISPISSNALNYYRYKFEGSFIEDGKEIDHIKVIPRRKYEPLFSGYINIVYNEWRIQSVQMKLTKESEMELVDTLTIEQLYVPYDENVWVIKSQVIYPAIKMFGFDAHGSFVNVYSKFLVNPEFDKKYFDKTILKYLDSSNKKSNEYWEQARPLPLKQEEIADYRKKDSLEKARKDPKYLDSLDKRRNKLSVMGLIFTGQGFSKQKKRSNIFINPLLTAFNYNTVEGLNVDLSATYTKKIDTIALSRKRFYLTPQLRYGFGNQHFNATLTTSYNFGEKYLNTLSLQGGKKVFQFNNASPVNPLFNTFASLFREKNYMKIYEAWVLRAGYSRTLDEGFSGGVFVQYQDRMPLENTTDYTWHDKKDVSFTPNYPTELTSENFKRHQALMASIRVSWQPGNRYIELPGRKYSIGSKYPRFSLTYTQGLHNIFGSDIDYGKWRFGITDNLNLKLKGTFRYNLNIGGFLNHDSVNIQDYTHFIGNQLLIAGPYLNSFQLAPYYKYSNTESFYSTLQAEHHFNGFLTNKIPMFRRLNWHLVSGTNAFYVNQTNNYAEVFVGLENILKIVRVDFVWGFEYGHRSTTGIRIGLKGALTGGNDD
jgi:hypothetical protein